MQSTNTIQISWLHYKFSLTTSGLHTGDPNLKHESLYFTLHAFMQHKIILFEELYMFHNLMESRCLCKFNYFLKQINNLLRRHFLKDFLRMKKKLEGSSTWFLSLDELHYNLCFVWRSLYYWIFCFISGVFILSSRKNKYETVWMSPNVQHSKIKKCRYNKESVIVIANFPQCF